MKTNKGYHIAQYEQCLPEGATIEEVRYHAKSGMKVNYVIGTVNVLGLHAAASADTVIKVTWDDEGLCRRRDNNQRLTDYDLDLAGTA